MALGRSFTRRWQVFVGALVVMTVLSGTAAVSANDPPGTTTTAVTKENTRETVFVAELGGLGDIQPGPSTSGATDWPYTCYFTLDLGQNGVPLRPIRGNTYLLRCNALRDDVTDIGPVTYTYDPTQPMAGLITPPQLRDAAEDYFDLPGFDSKLSPENFVPEAKQVTGIETWFWTDGSLAQQQATASIASITVTIWADYVETRIDLGEAGVDQLVCKGPKAWLPGADSDCVHTYLTEEIGREVTITNVWDFSSSTNGAAPEQYKTELHSQTFVVNVHDLEAVIGS